MLLVKLDVDKYAQELLFHLLWLYQICLQDKVLKLKKEGLFIYGEVKEYDHENKKIVAYMREYKGKKAFVVGNFSKKEVTYRLPELVKSDTVLINNYEDLIKDGQTIKLKPYQALVFEG
mgnify:CR=1 FL=1